MKKTSLVGLMILSGLWSNASVAGLMTAAYFEQGNDASISTPCSTAGGTSSNCSTRNYYVDANERFSFLSSNAEALASGTTLKARSSISFDGRHDASSIQAQIIANEVPDIADEAAYSQFMYDHPEYFDEEGNFDASAFLANNVVEMPDYVSSYASASFNDAWTITGGEFGTAGTISIFYQLDGMINNAILSDASSSVEGAANGTAMLSFKKVQNTQHPDGYTMTSVIQEDRFDLISAGSFDNLVELQLDFIFGQEFSIEFYLNSFTYAYLSHYGGNTPDFDISADFFNTAIFDSIKIKDDRGQFIEDYGLLSATGNTDFERTITNPGNTEIPEPSTFVLFSLGALSLLRTRYKK